MIPINHIFPFFSSSRPLFLPSVIVFLLLLLMISNYITIDLNRIIGENGQTNCEPFVLRKRTESYGSCIHYPWTRGIIYIYRYLSIYLSIYFYLFIITDYSYVRFFPSQMKQPAMELRQMSKRYSNDLPWIRLGKQHTA